MASPSPKLVVAMAILSIVMLVFTSTLASMQRAIVEEDVRSRSTTSAARVAVDRPPGAFGQPALRPEQPRRARVDPFGVGASGFLFRVYTQAQFGGDEDPRCAAWFVDDDRRLLYRYWPPLDEEAATDWQVVATGIVNRDEGEQPFVLDATGRTLTVELRASTPNRHPARGDPDLRRSPNGQQHVLRLSVEPLRRPAAGHVNGDTTMITNLHHHLRREDGVAMIVSLMVAFVVLMLSTIVVAQSLHSLDCERVRPTRLLSVNAAESGTNHWYQYLQTTPIAGLSCARRSRTSTPARAVATFEAAATFYAADGTTVMPCASFSRHDVSELRADQLDRHGHGDAPHDRDADAPHAELRWIRRGDPRCQRDRLHEQLRHLRRQRQRRRRLRAERQPHDHEHAEHPGNVYVPQGGATISAATPRSGGTSGFATTSSRSRTRRS